MNDHTALRRRLPPELSVLRRRTRLQVDWLDIDGIRVRHGLRRGRGRPMLLLGSLAANLDMMLPLVNALDDTEAIVVELPGTGESPTRAMPHRMGWHARLLHRLLARLGYDMPINLVGLGWGGALAQAFALRYPERTNRLVLAASSAGIGRSGLTAHRWKRFQTIQRYGLAKVPEDNLSSLYGGLIRRRPELVARRGSLASAPNTRGYIYQLAAGLGWTSIHRIHTLMCPTLIMGGDDDPISPLINSRLLYWLIPKSHLHVMRGGGHLFLLLRANESAAVILRFINERRYDGTDNADFYVARGLSADGRLVPPSTPTDLMRAKS